MKLNKIFIYSFRNIDEMELCPNERFNFFAGNNAQGKTNILESIYLLGTMKSFRMGRNTELIKDGFPYAILRGTLTKEDITREITLSIEPSGKKVKVDNKSITKLSEFFGCLNMVVFSPEDATMVRGLPETRRRYLDRAVFSGDFGYLSMHHEFSRILKNRNSLLKSGLTTGLDVWTERLAATGARLIKARISYIGEISSLLAGFYAIIAGPAHSAQISYRSEAIKKKNVSLSTDDIMHSLFDIFTRRSGEERNKGITLAGPHRDDMEFSLNGRSLKLHGSQGEIRTFMLALKMAEIEYIKRRHEYPPVLLLDDLTSELDGDRNRNFMDFLKSLEMQVFITTTNMNNLRLPETINKSVFSVNGGKIFQ